jgi:hypothetical protein
MTSIHSYFRPVKGQNTHCHEGIKYFAVHPRCQGILLEGLRWRLEGEVHWKLHSIKGSKMPQRRLGRNRTQTLFKPLFPLQYPIYSITYNTGRYLVKYRVPEIWPITEKVN